MHAQWPVGAYRIDLVVEGGDGNRLAIECDGDRWHYDKVAEDLARQALLERLGWRFVRIGGSAFYRDKNQAMKPVFDKLKALGIGPVASQVERTPAPAKNNILLDAIKRQAEQLRQAWAQQIDADML